MLTKILAGVVIVVSLALAGAAWSGAFNVPSEQPTLTPTSQAQTQENTDSPKPSCCPSSKGHCCEE